MRLGPVYRRSIAFGMMSQMHRKIKIIVERHEAGYVAYPLGLNDGVSIVGEGDTYDEALADVTSAIRFTLESAEEPVFSDDAPVLEVFVAEAEVPLSARFPADAPSRLRKNSKDRLLTRAARKGAAYCSHARLGSLQ